MERDTTSSNATDEPTLISARRQATVVVNSTANKGVDIRKFTCRFRISSCRTQSSGTHILSRYSANARPQSQANDQYILDEEATKTILAKTPSIITTPTVAELPDREPVAGIKIATNGYRTNDVDVESPLVQIAQTERNRDKHSTSK